MDNRLRLAAGLLVLWSVAAGCGRKAGGERETGMAATNGGPAVDTTAALAEIRKGDEAFFNAVKAHDAKTIADGYAEDAVSMPPNSPPLHGRDAILKFNQEFLKLPKLALTGQPETIRLSDDATMAYEAGKYSIAYADPKGRTVKDEGKYLNVLQRVGGQWKVVADAFSSNQPPGK
jgi:uncharacterized protein (TIGR02246 family)